MRTVEQIETEMRTLEAAEFTQDQYSERLAAEDMFAVLSHELSEAKS